MTVAQASNASPPSGAGAPGAGGTRSHEKRSREYRWQQDRWETLVAPVGRFSGAMGLILLLSLAVHVLIVGSALLASPADVVAPQQETPVEIVQEVPKEAPRGEASKLPAPAAPAPVKSAAAVRPSELRKGEPEQPDGKPEPQAAPTKPPPARPSPPRAAARQPPEPTADAPDEKLAALKSELEDLKAQREALEAERAEAQVAQSQAAQSRMAQSLGGTAAPVETGLGPLPDSFRAVALPMSGDGADEAVSYQQIVFSQLAKAKGIGGRQGQPGSAGVRFAIDEAGRLLSVEVVVASGIPTLDAEALAIVRKAAPFPPPPPGAQRTFVANVNFTPLPASLPSR